MPNGEKPCHLKKLAQKAGSEKRLGLWRQATVRNTRHTGAGLVEWKRQGLTDARILEHPPDVTQADLEAAWAYYATHREEIEQAIKEAEEA